jgi:hypothetical protein
VKSTFTRVVRPKGAVVTFLDASEEASLPLHPSQSPSRLCIMSPNATARPPAFGSFGLTSRFDATTSRSLDPPAVGTGAALVLALSGTRALRIGCNADCSANRKLD